MKGFSRRANRRASITRTPRRFSAGSECQEIEAMQLWPIAVNGRQRWPDSGGFVQSAFTNKWELYRQRGGWVSGKSIHHRGDVMRKILTALAVAGSLAVATVATSAPALAWRGGWGGWHGGWGWGGPAIGFAAGALIGSALAAPYYGGGYGYPYGGYYGYAAPYPTYYAPPTCVWRSLWNGYTWVRACV
jgi:hypothetical protein